MEKKIVEEEIATKVPPRKDYHGLPFFQHGRYEFLQDMYQRS
jgi:hypothetical protein